MSDPAGVQAATGQSGPVLVHRPLDLKGCEEDRAVALEDLKREYECAVERPDMKVDGKYPVGMRVDIIKPGARFSDDKMREAVADRGFQWVDKPLAVNQQGLVLAHTPHPVKEDVMVHVVRVDSVNTGKMNCVLMHPDGLQPALWKGLDVYVSREGARYAPAEGFQELFPEVLEEDWVPPKVALQNKLGKVVTIFQHHTRPETACFLVKIAAEQLPKRPPPKTPEAPVADDEGKTDDEKQREAEEREQALAQRVVAPWYAVLQGIGVRDVKIMPAMHKARAREAADRRARENAAERMVPTKRRVDDVDGAGTSPDKRRRVDDHAATASPVQPAAAAPQPGPGSKGGRGGPHDPAGSKGAGGKAPSKGGKGHPAPTNAYQPYGGKGSNAAPPAARPSPHPAPGAKGAKGAPVLPAPVLRAPPGMAPQQGKGGKGVHAPPPAQTQAYPPAAKGAYAPPGVKGGKGQPPAQPYPTQRAVAPPPQQPPRPQPRVAVPHHQPTPVSAPAPVAAPAPQSARPAHPTYHQAQPPRAIPRPPSAGGAPPGAYPGQPAPQQQPQRWAPPPAGVQPQARPAPYGQQPQPQPQARAPPQVAPRPAVPYQQPQHQQPQQPPPQQQQRQPTYGTYYQQMGTQRPEVAAPKVVPQAAPQPNPYTQWQQSAQQQQQQQQSSAQPYQSQQQRAMAAYQAYQQQQQQRP
eukprot:TRINITY_DN2050_c0_g3_i1.p1 TRINITY_DN2050_c0_g3~~TRINITY_DN2050_c0_g3_i1.p1  ORF type:complete len:707 (+),score=144.11 TRINITY_DN2050_c0_g3_i1:47-2122(+)